MHRWHAELFDDYYELEVYIKTDRIVRRIVKWNLYSEGSLMIQELKFDPIFLQSKHYLHNAFESKRNWDITILA